MKRKLLASLFILCASVALAQNTMTVTSTTIPDLGGSNLQSGQACFLATDNSGNPISIKAPGGGQVMRRAKCVSVTNGAFTVSLPNTTASVPVNPCLQLTVTDTSNNTTVLDKGYECLQPSPSATWCSAGTCNLDNFIPNNAPGVAVTPGPVGPAGPPGPVGPALGGISFTDNGALSSWTASAQVPVSQHAAIRSMSVTTTSPWVGCSTPATVTLVDNLGDTAISSYLGGPTFSKGTFDVALVVMNSGVQWVAPVFTSAVGCSQYATGIQVSVTLDSVVMTITPSVATVTHGTTATFTELITYASDLGSTSIHPYFITDVTWSVDGIVGGNSSVGMINGGSYTAPASTGTHTISSTSTADAAVTGFATVTVN
jgi:hypothetical protein